MQPPAPPSWLTVAQQQPPLKDQHSRTCFVCYFVLGAGILSPWNAFISASDFYEALFPGRHVDRLFTVAYLPVCLAFLGLMIKYNQLPARPRILASFACFTGIMLLVPLLDALVVGQAAQAPQAALSALLAAVVLVGVLDGLSQGAIFGDAAALPPTFTHAVVGGTASSGAIICLLRLATKAALPPTRAGLRASTALFFGLSAGLCGASYAIYAHVLPRLGVVQHYRQAAAERTLELSPQPSLTNSGLAVEAVLQHDATAGGEQQRPLVRRLSGGGGTHSSADDVARLALLDGALRAGQVGATEFEQRASGSGAVKRPHSTLSWRHVLAEAWRSALALFIVYAVTLSIFPGVLAEDIQSARLGDWLPLLLMTLFNLSDLAGKNVPFGRLAPAPRALLAWALARAAFVPAFLLAVKFVGGAAQAWLVAALTAALGLSNGLLTALLMTLAPATVEAGEGGLVENILVFCLVAGLAAGAAASWLWLL